MTDLQEKAMRMALERLESHEYWMDEEAIKALRQALAIEEQISLEYCDKCGWRAIVPPDGCLICDKKKWVGLTDEEGAEIWGDAHDIDGNRLVTPKEIVRRIEAKLKEKNGG